jgi:cellulose synthase/poly-beta-1,6-N-acetylglucosamine synthase-like glycosyltransferase
VAAFALVALSLAALGLATGYTLFLRRTCWGANLPAPPQPGEPLPHLDVIVPTHDEAALVEGKIENLRRIAYPGPLRVWIVDGDSGDRTRERARAAIGNDTRFRLVALDVADKTAQLNAVLAMTRVPWILVSDADARFDPDVPAALVATGEADPSVAVVGVAAEPASAHPLERLHWRLCNRLRAAEARRGSASHVLGPCYAFRRSLLEQLPADVANDDCHVSFAASTAGARVAWLDRRVVELRAPQGLGELLVHKRRKAAGYLREVIRFLPQARRMSSPARGIFLWRSALLLAAPLLGAAVLANATTLAVQQPAATTATALGGWLLLAGVGRGLGLRPGTPARLVALAGVLAWALAAALVSLPFRPPSARYPKTSLAPDALSPSASDR